MTDERLNYRVVWIGTSRQRTHGLLGILPAFEPERDWRQRLAKEMEDASQEMAHRGLRLIHVVPVQSSVSLQGGWTEGVWLYFESDRDRAA